jgi:probable phosphoglycerate mutase
MRLILVRHGEAHAGFHGVIAGPRGCSGLTDHGRLQAEALREHLLESGHLKADVLIASVLPRAIETAHVIAPGLGFESFKQDCDLCEVHPGEADAVPWSEYESRYGALDMVAEPDRAFAPGGESWNGFHARVQRTLERLAADYPDQTVVAVCHAGVIMASIRTLFGIPPHDPGTRLQPANTGLTEWEFEPVIDRWTLHSFNDTCHLLRLPRDHEAPADRVEHAEV